MMRVLQCVNKMDRAGIETMLMNYYKNINREEIQFDFLTHREESGEYDKEIESLGGKVFHAPRLTPFNYIKYFRFMKDFFREHPEYKIVHSHIDTMSFFPLLAAKMCGVKIRIAHSHSSKLDKDYKLPIKYLAKINVSKVANYYFSCGEKAGKFLYGNKKFTILNNAIDIDKFKFSKEKRKEIRNRFSIPEEAIVLGHVGRFIYIKNQMFLIDLLSKLVESSPDYILIMIGLGQDYEKLKKHVSELNLENHVKFLFNRSDVNELYNAMDIFVMPSLFEGFPLVSVEAQANGLNCIFSDNISKEVLLTSTANMISLNDIDVWFNRILELNGERNAENIKVLKVKGFDIKQEALKLCNIYKDLEKK